MYLKEMGCPDVNWIHLTWGRGVVNTVMNLQV
jgi:hypothetical protein